MIVDIIGRELTVGDHIVFHNQIYEILELPKYQIGMATIILFHKSRTTHKVQKPVMQFTLLPKEDVLIRILKNGTL